MARQQSLPKAGTEKAGSTVVPRADMPVAIQLIEAGSERQFFHQCRDALLESPDPVSQFNVLKVCFVAEGAQTNRDEKIEIHSGDSC